VYNISTMNLKEFAVTCALCGLVVNYLPYHMTANHSSSSTTTYTSSYPQSTEPDPPGTLYPTIPPLDNTGSVQGTVTSTTTTL